MCEDDGSPRSSPAVDAAALASALRGLPMIAARLAAAGAGSNGKSGGTPDPHAPSFIGMVYAPYTAQRGKLLASTGELLASTASADVRAHARTLPGPQKEWARANLPEGATMGPVRAALGGLAQCARRAADWARGIDGERAGAYPAGADAGGGTTSADDDESRKLLFASPRDATTALDVLEARRRKRLRAKRPSQWAQQQRSKAEERNAPGSGPDGGSRHEDDGEGGGGEKGRSAAGGSTASSRPVKTSPGGPTIATGATELPEEHRALLEELLGIKLVGGGASDGGDGGLRDASTDNAGDMGEDASDSSSESDEDGRVGGIALRDAVDLFLGSAVRHSPTGERRAPTCALLPAREDLVAARTLRKQETGVDAPFEGVPVFSADGLHIGLGETRQKQAQREAQRSQQARVPFGVPDQQGAVREKEEGDASDDVRGGNGDAVTVGGEGESSAGPLDVSATADAAASVTGSEDPGSGSLPLVDAEAGERARDGGSPFGDLLSDSLGAFGAGSDGGGDGNLGRVEVEVDQISEGGDWDTGEAVADDDAPSWRTPYFLSRAQLDKFTQLQLEVSCAACLEARREERRERERRAAARSGRGKGGTNGGGSDRGGGGPMGASGGGMGDDEDDIGEMDPPDVDEFLSELGEGGEGDSRRDAGTDLAPGAGDFGAAMRAGADEVADAADRLMLATSLGRRALGVQPPKVHVHDFGEVLSKCERDAANMRGRAAARAARAAAAASDGATTAAVPPKTVPTDASSKDGTACIFIGDL